MVLEFLNRQLEDVRARIRQGLLETRKRDRRTRDLQERLNIDEKQFLADLMSEIKRLRTIKNGELPEKSDEKASEKEDEGGDVSLKDEPFQGEGKNSSSNVEFDEERFEQRAKQMLSERANLLGDMENKIESVKSVYDFVDQKIKDFDASTVEISHLLQERTGVATKKKKKKRPDPNEPVYCTCRKVSSGQMIACENEQCVIEWFHFHCVGLTAEPKISWYCADCVRARDEALMAADDE